MIAGMSKRDAGEHRNSRGGIQEPWAHFLGDSALSPREGPRS